MCLTESFGFFSPQHFKAWGRSSHYKIRTMKATDINSRRPRLDWLLNQAIIKSFQNVFSKCSLLGSTPEEPDFIASLTIDFTPELFTILKLLYPKYKFSVTGVFCHQKPLADFGTIPCPEIGDILFVYIHTDQYGNKRLNSLLLQAKISTSPITRIARTDYHQLKLYKEWPEFAYRRADGLNGVTRNIQPKVANDGAQYLLIDNDPTIDLTKLPHEFPMGCALPQDILHLDRNLSTELINFFKFKAGRSFEENYTLTNDDWTKMIWDLLKITKLKASRRKNVGFSSFDRQVTEMSDGLCFIRSESSSIFSDLETEINDDFSKDNDLNSTDNEGGISIILVESTEQEGSE